MLSDKDLTICGIESKLIKDWISKHSISLVFYENNEPEARPIEIFSGVCIKLGNTLGIATAAHTLRDKDIQTLSFSFSSRLIPRNKFVELVVLEGGGDKDPLDVAFLKLSQEGIEAISKYKKFLERDAMMVQSRHAPDDRVALYGVPSSYINNSQWDQKILGLGTFLYTTVTIDEQPAGAGFNPDIDIALAYPQDGNFILETGVTHPVPDVNGMSGCGIWSIGLDREKIWSTNCIKLIGIEISWKKNENWVRGNQIQHVLDLEYKLATGTLNPPHP